MDSRQLNAFIAVFEERNITAAAQRLHLSQPALSGTIKSLESLLGAQLFERQARGVSVTDEARILYPQARRLVAQTESMARQFRQDIQVLLRGGFGHQQTEQHRYGLAVRRVERDGLRQADEGGKRLLQALHAAVRHGHALAERGRAQALPRKQAVEHECACQAVVVFKEEASLFERALLARGEHIEDDVAGGKDARQMIHQVIIGLYDALQKNAGRGHPRRGLNPPGSGRRSRDESDSIDR